MLRDVLVDRMEQNDVVAVSHTPATVGEEMSLDLIGNGGSVALNVRVLESRPIVVAGSMRHRLRLAVNEPRIGPGRPGTSIAARPIA